MDEHLKKIIFSILFKTIGYCNHEIQKKSDRTASTSEPEPAELLIEKWVSKADFTEHAPYIHKIDDEDQTNPKISNWFTIISEAEKLMSLTSETAKNDGNTICTNGLLLNIFNNIKLNDLENGEVSYFPPRKIGSDIPYPGCQDDSVDCDLKLLWREFEQELSLIKNNLTVNALLMLTEKYFSFVPCANFSGAISDVSVYQQAKMTAAIATNIVNSLSERKFQEENAITSQEINRHLLVGGDISGVQDFIYTISSTGALKSLRGRSFYLEMLTEKVVVDLLTALGISSANLIYSGGGGFFMLAHNTQESRKDIQKIRTAVNKWLFQEFEGKLYFNIEFVEFCGSDLTEVAGNGKEYPFASIWRQLSWKIEGSKNKKHHELLDTIFIPAMPQNRHESCPVCHTDEKVLQTGFKHLKTCRMCSDFSKISQYLIQNDKYRFLCEADNPGSADFYIQDTFYRFNEKQTAGKHHFIINSWDIEDWKNGNGTQLLIANHFSGSEELEDLSEKSAGRHLIGALRMDVDNLGSIFIHGLQIKSITRMAELSRRFTLFFKYYLNFICNGMIKKADRHQISSNSSAIRPVDIIYAGGDDLFILGAWNQTAEIAFDIRKVFKRYTGSNPCVTLSAGVTLHRHNYPVYQIAKLSEKAENEAKNNKNSEIGAFKHEKDSLSLFYTDTRKNNNALYLDRMARRSGWDTGPNPEKMISLAEFWDDAEHDIFQNTFDLYNGIDWSVVSHGFFRKMFEIVDIWLKDGVFYIPSLHYLVNRSKNELGDGAAMFLERLNTEFMPKLLIPLTWIEYLHRKEGK